MSNDDTPCRKLKRMSDEFYKEHTPGDRLKRKKLNTPSPRTSNTRCKPPSPTPSPPGTDSRCGLTFFDCPCEQLARNLLGCVLFRAQEDGGRSWGRVVETEAYLGGEDKASHSYNGKRTERNEAMYMSPGTAYVYSIYGVHRCFNVSSRGGGAAVLIRALEPLGGVAAMFERRKSAKERDLCNGPAKLCRALGIDKTCNKTDLISSQDLWVELGGEAGPWSEVVESGRVGVEYAGAEWAGKPLRFYYKDCPYVSRR